MKKYEVVTYSSDIGSDSKMDFSRLADAVKDAKRYKKTEEYAAVFDREQYIAYVVFGDLDIAVFVESVKVVPVSVVGYI